MKRNTRSSSGLLQRARFLNSHPVWRSQYIAFVKAISKLELLPGSTGLSVSCGDGTWDYLAQVSNQKLGRLVATDVVDCLVSEDDIALLNTQASWNFQKVVPDRDLPLDDNSFELVFHMDVIEHTPRPSLLLEENLRVLKPGGYLLCGTPNIVRPANIAKLLLGKLTFPFRLDTGLMNPSYLNPGIRTEGMIHVQEFNQYQLRIMLEEAGFEVVSLVPCFFGISFLKINFCDFPTSNLGQNLCQYIFCVARKRQ